MVVARATEVVVVVGQRGLSRLTERLLVEAVFEDGLDTFVAIGASPAYAQAESCVDRADGRADDRRRAGLGGSTRWCGR